MKAKEIFKENIFTKNPLYILLLGMCPSLAITTSIENALGMMGAVTVVLLLTNLVVSLIRKIVPEEIRLPVYIIIIAAIVTSLTQIIQAFALPLYTALGIFLPLITVNCLILGRAEAFASKNSVGMSLLDALSSGIGYGLGLVSIALFRELLGTGTITFHNVFGAGEEVFNLSKSLGIYEAVEPYRIGLLQNGMGAFLMFGLLSALAVTIASAIEKKKKKKEEANKLQEDSLKGGNE